MPFTYLQKRKQQPKLNQTNFTTNLELLLPYSINSEETKQLKDLLEVTQKTNIKVTTTLKGKVQFQFTLSYLGFFGFSIFFQDKLLPKNPIFTLHSLTKYKGT